MLQTHLSIPFLVRKPSSNQKTKLVILLHGYGSNEEDLFSFAQDFPDYFLVISLRAVRNSPMGGYCWYDINFLNNEKFTDTEQAKESIQLIYNFVSELKTEYTFDENDIWLCGFSQGGILSYALGLLFSEKFKKILCLSAYPERNIIQTPENKDYSASKFFISHGKDDVVIPVEWARNGEILMKETHIDYFYKEYNAGHGINPDNYRDMMIWILDHNK